MSGSYPFIEIAALDKIREGLAKGDAQIVLSHDLSTVLWANWPGAALFGFNTVQKLMVDDFNLPVAARRQITSTFDNERETPSVVAVRLGSGLRSELTHLQISHILLPDGIEAVLLAAHQNNSPEAIITGLGDENTHIALFDAAANLLATSSGFEALEISSATLEDLIIEVEDAQDHIVTRRIRAGKQSLAGTVLRLADEPATHLISIVSEPNQSALPVATFPKADAHTQPSSPEKEPSSSEKEIVSKDKAESPFSFDHNSPPVRFIWKINAEGVFTEISPELPSAIGPNSADIVGRKFSEVAQVFGFDADGSVSTLLRKRDTWSGKRLLWPVEGTSLRVPVELAALPVYSRDRDFIGFRGFGLVRPVEASEDPEMIGLVLSGQKPPKRQVEEETTDLDTEDDDVLALSEEVANDDRQGASRSRPPLTITPNEGRRENDKVIELLHAAAREKVAVDLAKAQKTRQEPSEPRPEGGLTPTERNAFREIAERLRRQGISTAQNDETVAETPKNKLAGPVSAATPLETSNEKSGSVKTNHSADPTALLSDLPIPVIIHSGDRIHYINQAFINLTGYNSIEAIQSTGGVEALFNSDPDNTEKSQGLILRHSDGKEEAVDAHLNAINWGKGRALMLSLMPVVAQSKETSFVGAETNAAEVEKQALETHVDELKTILDTATDGVVLIDPEGRIRSMNHSASALFGYEPEDTQSKYFSMLFAIESQRAAMDYLQGLSDNGVMSVLNDGREVIGREAQGGFIPLFMTIGKLPNGRGYCAVLRDITQWKRTEEELTKARREAERASTQKTEFLARISHEIRTPLNAIIGFSELMADEKFGPIGNDRYRDYLRDINRSGNHVLALVNDLLDISKIEAGALDLQFEAVSLNDAIGEALALMQPQANRDRVIIRSSFQPNLPDIVADVRSIKQVALNLLSNAVRYTATGGQVIVSTNYELNGDVILRVRDTGIGMSKAEIEQALKPFRQVNSLQRRTQGHQKDWRGEGTGLGLPLTKAMVEANRAHFTINSSPGQGTVVEVVFPPTRVLAD